MSRLDDDAIEREANILMMRIRHIRKHGLNTGNPSGLCWYCDEEIGHDRRFCDSDCRDDWQREY